MSETHEGHQDAPGGPQGRTGPWSADRIDVSETMDRVAAAMAGHEPWSDEWTDGRRDGSWVAENVHLIENDEECQRAQIEAVIRDATEAMEKTEALLRWQRGRLAGLKGGLRRRLEAQRSAVTSDNEG